jgi:hypothetical protein
MRTLKFISLFGILLLGFSSCRKDPFLGIWGKGENVTEVRDLSGFSGIDLGMNANVYYLQDSIYRVEVIAQPNIIGHIETEVQGKVLKIDCRPRLHRCKTISIIIHSPDMDYLHLGGSGNIDAQNPITTQSMEVSLSGSGNISIYSVTANDLTAKISGSGNVTIGGGSVSSENFSVSGSGNLDALDLVCDTCVASISGSGNMQIHVIKHLNVSISGSGSVKYRGYPSVETHISGSGNVTHIN